MESNWGWACAPSPTPIATMITRNICVSVMSRCATSSVGKRLA